MYFKDLGGLLLLSTSTMLLDYTYKGPVASPCPSFLFSKVTVKVPRPKCGPIKYLL